MKKEKGSFSNYSKQINDAIEDLKTKGRRHKQIPNILTLLRLTAPLVILPAAISGNVPFIIGAITAFGLTDLADGFIARNWNLTSKLGADLDALADKIFAGTLLLAASVANPILLVNVGLEISIAGINLNQKAHGKEAASTLMGKIKTFSLFPLAGAGIISAIKPMPTLVVTLTLTTTALQALTIQSYLNKYNKKLKKDASLLTPKMKTEVVSEETDNCEKEKMKIVEFTTTTNQMTENSKVNRLRDMREFLIQEQELFDTPVVQKESKVYKKTKEDKV